MDPSSTQSVNNLETLNAFSTEFVKFDFCSADYYVLFCHNLLSNLAIDASSRMKLTYTRPGFDTALSLVFICQENSRLSEILLFADHPRFCWYIGYSPEVCPRFFNEFGGKWKVAKNRTLNRNVTAFQQFRGLVMNEIHRWQMVTSLMVQIWVFICWQWSLIIAEIWDASGK